MADDALLFMCVGCCCGRSGYGGALAPARVLKTTARAAFEVSGLAGRARLAFTECLGPCSESNVAFLYVHGRPLWFRRLNTPDVLRDLLAYAATASENGGDHPLPPRLLKHSFEWTGGGIGPKPPCQDGEDG